MNRTETLTPMGLAPATLDRLVDGELDERARSALLRELDGTPDGWKRCALAFLEAQAWGQAAGTPESGQIAPVAVKGSGSGRRPLGPLIAIAAAIVVAFCAGFASRGTEREHVVAQRTEAPVPPPVPPPVTPPARPAKAEADAAPATVSDSVRRQMERQGYQIQGGRRLVPVALGDGRKVAVPVDTVSLRYVGQRIH